MTRAVKILAALALVLCAGVCAAGDAAKDRLVQTLMRKSGLTRQIDQMPPLIQAVLEQEHRKSGALSPADFDKLREAARAAFASQAMLGSVRAYLDTNLSERDIEQALVWLGSPLGTRITRFEEDASTPAGFAEMQSMAPGLMKEHEGTSRAAKLRKLDKAIKATESTVNVALNVQLATMAAALATMEAGPRPSYDELRGLVDANKELVRASVEDSVRAQFLYSYRELTDAEIDRYIRFAESEPGRKYHSVTCGAVNEAMVRAARRLGTHLGMRWNSRESF